MSHYNLPPTGAIMTPWGMQPVYADHFMYQPARHYPLSPPAFSGNAHQRRVKRRAWLRENT